PSIHAFRLSSVGALLCAFFLQVLVIVVFTYGGNELFFRIHEPEKSCIITASQESLDYIVRAIFKIRRQYKIENVLDYRDPSWKKVVANSETFRLVEVIIVTCRKIIRKSYKQDTKI